MSDVAEPGREVKRPCRKGREVLRAGCADTLRAAGHQAQPLDGTALCAAVARGLEPLPPTPMVCQPDLPLATQVLDRYPTTCTGGWTFTDGISTETAQVLSLHHAPPQTYPGILCAPRAPKDTQPLALWQAWSGPLTIVVN